MLGKLMKYELKACGRIFLPLYLGILFLAAINGVNLGANFNTVDGFPMDPSALNTQTILSMILIALFVALFVITIVLTIQRFKKNLLDDEGYLMFTLPVKSSNLILSKFLVALIYGITSVIVALLSFFIIGAIGGDFNISDFLYVFAQQSMFSENGAFFIYIILGTLIEYSIFVLTIYLSLSAGQLPQLSKYRVAAGVILFFIINLIISNIQSFVGSNLFAEGIEIEATSNLTSTIISYMSANLLLNIIIGLILFLSTNWILNKKLNLE